MARYVIHDENLYRTMGDWPLLKYVPQEEENYILKEMHEGICKAYIVTNVLVLKIMRYSYFWPIIREDAKEIVWACIKCQIHSNDHYVPQNEYHCMISPIPFAQ